jgi:hypothetical protein
VPIHSLRLMGGNSAPAPALAVVPMRVRPNACGFRMARITQKMEYMAARAIPGTTPARKSLLMDSCVSTPQTIMRIDGGISMPSDALPAMQPSETFLSYPALHIAG